MICRRSYPCCCRRCAVNFVWVPEHPLTAADLGDGAKTAPGTWELLAGAQLLHHPSAGSLYLNFYYDLGNVKPEDMQYLDLLTDVLDELDSSPSSSARYR